MSTSFSQARSTLRPDIGEVMESIDLIAQREGLIGLGVAPVFDVVHQAGTFSKIPIKSLILGDVETRRNSDGTYNSVNGEMIQDSFATEENGLEEIVDRREQATWLSYWDGEKMAADRVTYNDVLAHTKRVVSAIGALDWTGKEASAAAKWNTGSANPQKDVDDGRIAMRNAYGLLPNCLMLGYEAYLRVRTEPAILDALFGSVNPENAANVTAKMLATVFDLEEVIVSMAQKNTANELKDAVLADVWDKTKALLFVRRTDRNLQRPHFMRTFHWSEDGSMLGTEYETYYSNEKRSDVVRHRMDTQEKVLNAEAAYRINAVL